MTKDQEQKFYDRALEELPGDLSGTFYQGFVRGVLAAILVLRNENWEPGKPPNAP